MKRYNVALVLNRPMANSIFAPRDLAFLATFADFNAIDGLPDALSAACAARLYAEADACITCWGTPAFTEAALENAPGLRLVVHAAGSVKNLVPATYWDTGRRIASNAPVIAEDVAQTVLAFVLCSLKQLWGFARSTREGLWSGGEVSTFKTRRLDGLQVGVVGSSNVGRAVISILRPFGCDIVLYDPYVSAMDAAALGVRTLPLDELLATSDVITLHAPPVEECRHMINAQNAPTIKDGALFINTARGMLVDEAALVKELRTGRFFACIDVTDPEPPAADHPFRELENVILTPHIAGGHTVNGRKMLGANAINEVYSYLVKGFLRYEVRKDMLALMA